ncbi:MAG: SPOR domain-containing protein [Treponema sp.]|nr:SPOR domain-containing protein [Treponema sp.]
MKKIFVGILVAAAAFAAVADSITGSVAVADAKQFPSGYFGQAAGYLPGDSVYVTNPENGVTLQFLNLGTLDSEEGTVILLSKESAKVLGIEDRSGLTVSLDKRYGSFDETVTGRAELVAKAAVFDQSAPAEPRKAAPTSAEEAPVVTVDAPAPVAVDAPAPVAAAVPAGDAEPFVPVAAPVAGVPLFDDDDAEEEPVEVIEETAPAPVVETAPVVEEAPVEEAAAEPEEVVVVELPVTPVEDEVAEEAAVPAEEAPEEIPVVVEIEEPVEDYENEEDSFEDTKVLVEQPSPMETAEAVEVEEPVEVEVLPAAEEAVAVEEVIEEVEETEEEAEEIAEVEEEEDDDDEYAPIVLVPADPVVPPAEEVAEDVAETAAAEAPVEVAPAPVAVAPVAAEVDLEGLRSESKTLHSYDEIVTSHVCESEDLLPKNCWYIQIAAMGNRENLVKTLNKYEKYPIVLVPNGKGAYRVLVGPLSVDEYGAVLAKFKSFGFKDAFLRKK